MKQQQKGVDILLAIECLTHALRENIDVAVIMTCDLDFFPLLEALLHTKTKSWLVYQTGKTSNDLILAADRTFPLTINNFLSSIVGKEEIKSSFSYTNKALKEFNLIKSGHFEGQKLDLLQHPKAGVFMCAMGEKGIGIARPLACLAELEFEEIMRGKIAWS